MYDGKKRQLEHELEEVDGDPIGRITKLTRILKAEAQEMTTKQVRFLVDAFYQVQEHRIATKNQVRSEEQCDNPIIAWLASNIEEIEKQVKLVLSHYSKAHPVGKWMESICGIGPVISAGYLAHIDITKAPTVGHIWSFAGLDPRRVWPSDDHAKQIVKDALDRTSGEVNNEEIERVERVVGASPGNLLAMMTGIDGKPVARTVKNLLTAMKRRPWNAKLKTLCWKTALSFTMQSHRDSDVYGKLYRKRKEYEVGKNNAGDYKEQALAKAEAYPKHAQVETYKAGKLPDGHIDMRARRWVAKLFLAHLHEVWYFQHYKQLPPKPYILEYPDQAGHKHIHRIAPPNMELISGLIEAWKGVAA